MINNKTFSENLTRIRKQKGLSQRELANLSGISPRMISHYEKHVTYPPIEKIEIIAKALDVSISDLLGLNKNDNKEIEFNESDVRTIKKIKRILLLNSYDRSTIYQMIDLLLQKDEYTTNNKTQSTKFNKPQINIYNQPQQ